MLFLSCHRLTQSVITNSGVGHYKQLMWFVYSRNQCPHLTVYFVLCNFLMQYLKLLICLWKHNFCWFIGGTR